GEGGAQPDSYTYNPYAAMPSLHVGYALVVAWGVFVAERRLWVRLAAILYPILMAATVVISGNHWILDVAGAAVTVVASGIILLSISRLQSLVFARWTAFFAVSKGTTT
ncbi:MAG TPA: phosphatase PAP2 family protein, partial [Chloroflexota bacterium]